MLPICIVPRKRHSATPKQDATWRLRVWRNDEIAQFGPPGVLQATTSWWHVTAVQGPVAVLDALAVGRSKLLLLVPGRRPLVNTNTLSRREANARARDQLGLRTGGPCAELVIPRTFNSTGVWATAIAARCSWLAAGDSLGGVTVWKRADASVHGWVGAHTGLGAVAVELTPGALISCGADGAVKLFGLHPALPLLAQLSDVPGVPTALCAYGVDDGLNVVVGLDSERCVVWHPASDAFSEVVTPGLVVTGLTCAPDESLVAASTAQGRGLVFHLKPSGEIAKALVPYAGWAGFVRSEAGPWRLVDAAGEHQWPLAAVRDWLSGKADERTRTVAEAQWFDEDAAAAVLCETAAVRVVATQRALNVPRHARLFTDLVDVDAGPQPPVVARQARAPKPKPRPPLAAVQPKQADVAPPFCVSAVRSRRAPEFFLRPGEHGEVLFTA